MTAIFSFQFSLILELWQQDCRILHELTVMMHIWDNNNKRWNKTYKLAWSVLAATRTLVFMAIEKGHIDTCHLRFFQIFFAIEENFTIQVMIWNKLTLVL